MNQFDAENHIYRSDSAGRLPGATDVIKSQGVVSTEWMSDDARWRGKCVHRGFELMVKGELDWETVDVDVRGYLTSAQEFLRMTGFELLGAETPCFSGNVFACIPDVWGILNGVPTIVELKTGPVPKWAAIQTALQKIALKSENGFEAVKRFGLQLLPTGSVAKLVPFEDRRDEYRALEMVDLFHWRVENGYIKDWK